MRILKIFTFLIIFSFSFFGNFDLGVLAQEAPNVVNIDVSAPKVSGEDSRELKAFTNKFGGHFITFDTNDSKDAIGGTFFEVARTIKNAFLFIAVAFLIYGVIKLFFSDASDDDVSKWKKNIAWTTAGVIFMQIAFNIWKTGLQYETGGKIISARFGWELWGSIFEPLVHLFQYFASFAFLGMMIYAFYIIVTGGGDDEKLSKGKNTLIFALIGFVLIQIPHRIVNTMYGGIPECEWLNSGNSTLWTMAQPDCKAVTDADFSGGIGIIADIIKYVNGFLTVFCVIMAIYAGWLLFISRGEEDKVSKAKRIIIYIIIGIALLVASHAIFTFFLMPNVR